MNGVIFLASIMPHNNSWIVIQNQKNISKFSIICWLLMDYQSTDYIREYKIRNGFEWNCEKGWIGIFFCDFRASIMERNF